MKYDTFFTISFILIQKFYSCNICRNSEYFLKNQFVFYQLNKTFFLKNRMRIEKFCNYFFLKREFTRRYGEWKREKNDGKKEKIMSD